MRDNPEKTPGREAPRRGQESAHFKKAATENEVVVSSASNGTTADSANKELPELAASVVPATATAHAMEFLRWWLAGGPWVLTAIHPEKKSIKGAVLTTKRQVEGFVGKYANDSNIYFHVNTVSNTVRTKAKREDVLSVEWLHVDIDARPGELLENELRRIRDLLGPKRPNSIPEPTVIVFSGGGFQAYWKLADPEIVNCDIAIADNLALYNAWLADELGGDHCQDVSRIMRLPGTVNRPDKKKRDKGRAPTLAKLIKFEAHLVYPLSAFQKATVTTAKRDAPVCATVSIASLDELKPYNLRPRLLVIIELGHDPEKPKKGDNSRSGWVMDVACNLMRADVPEGKIRGILSDPRWGISKSVRTQKYLDRQIARAKEKVAQDVAEFRRDKNELIVRDSQHNIRVALHKLGVSLSHDEFQDQMLVEGVAEIGPILDDRAMEHLWLLVDEKFGFRPGKDLFWTVVAVAARKNGFHPVRDYLNELSWDGKPRIDTLLIDYGGAEESPYTRAVGALMLVAAVRRIRKPGCKFDEMLVLESEQGKDKSSALKVLAVREEWFTDDMPLNADSKGVIERLRGRWIVECAELDGMKRGNIDYIKAFLSRQVDRARLSYDRLNTEAPRQVVFFGTANGSKYLRDTTGARRFWPVRVKTFDLDALRRDRDQLWAEAAQREAAGESIRLDPALYAVAAVEQGERSVEDPFYEQLEHVLDGLNGKILTADVWEIIDVPMGQRQQSHNARLGEAMKRLGWERTKARINGRVSNVYMRGGKSQQELRIRVRRDPEDHVKASVELDTDQQRDGGPPF